MPFQEWSTNYPTTQDTGTNATDQQEDLSNDPGATATTVPATEGSNTRVSHVHTLRNKVQELALKVGDDSDLPAGSNRARLTALEAAPPSHAASHQDGGADEISVTGLSGELADAQKVAVQDEGTPIASHPTIDFVGAGVTASDSGSKTTVTIAGGGGVGIDASVNTDTASTTVIHDAPLADDTAAVFDMNLIAAQTAGTAATPAAPQSGNVNFYRFVVKAVRVGSGVPTITTVTILNGPDEDVPAWDFSVTGNGGNVRFEVTGAAATTIMWRLSGNCVEVTP